MLLPVNSWGLLQSFLKYGILKHKVVHVEKGGTRMHVFWQYALLIKKFKIRTKLTQREIIRKFGFFLEAEEEDYCGHISADGFVVAERTVKYFLGGHSHNSFAPVCVAALGEEDGMAVVSAVIRMNFLSHMIYMPIYWLSILTLLPIPFIMGLTYFAYWKPAKKLQGALLDLLTEEPD